MTCVSDMLMIHSPRGLKKAFFSEKKKPLLNHDENVSNVVGKRTKTREGLPYSSSGMQLKTLHTVHAR